MRIFYKKVCISCTNYSTLLYLLLCKNLKEVSETLFFLDGQSVSKELHDNLHREFFLYRGDILSKKELIKIKIKNFRYFKWRCLFSQFYVLDHMPGIDLYLGHHPYNLLEDAPGIFQRMETCTLDILKDKSINTLRWKLYSFIFRGAAYLKPMGRSRFCINRIITDSKDVHTSLVKGKKYTLVNLKELWDEKDEEYKEWMLNIFSLNSELIKHWNTIPNIILTEPMISDFGLSEEEFIECYKEEILKYKSEGVIIKPHPRDCFDWNKHFPDIEIMNTKMPMQFLSVIGINPKRAITISSSAVSVFNSQQTELIFLKEKVYHIFKTKKQLQ